MLPESFLLTSVLPVVLIYLLVVRVHFSPALICDISLSLKFVGSFCSLPLSVKVCFSRFNLPLCSRHPVGCDFKFVFLIFDFT